MRVLRFICNMRGKHALGDYPIDYLPSLYSVWRCKICRIKNIREMIQYLDIEGSELYGWKTDMTKAKLPQIRYKVEERWE